VPAPIRFSLLKEMGKSPAHYRYAVDNDGREQTPAMRLGKAVHSLILGGDPVLFFPGVRRGNAWDAFEAANTGAIILNEAEHEKARGMAAAVRASAPAMRVLEGRHEVEVNWQYLGRAWQSHIDVIAHDGSYVTELKTGATSDPVRFVWQAIKLHYNGQLAAYGEAMRSSGLGDPLASHVVCVESQAPYVTTTFRLTERALEQGRKALRLWAERLAACEAADHWPGYCESAVPLDVPDDELELEFNPETGEVAA
jgi:hypothetical protein